MKQFLTTLCVSLALVTSVEAASSKAKARLAPQSTKATSATKAEIARKVEVLGNIAWGLNVQKVKGKNARDMIIKLAVEMYGDEEEVLANFLDNATSKDFTFSDQSGWGTTDLNSAIDLFRSQDGRQDEESGEEIENQKALKVADEILKELDAMGVVFGFTDNSSSYCGVSFMGLLIVDVDNGLVYEIQLTGGGGC